MVKIATHDSITGEKGSFWSRLLSPFCKCQTLSIEDQYKAGATMFDFRVKKHNGVLYGAHGLWRTKRQFLNYLTNLYFAVEDDSYIYYSIVYEGFRSDFPDFLERVKFYNSLAPEKMILTYAAYKHTKGAYDKYDYVYRGSDCPPNKQDFDCLAGKNWHKFIPIPWLWNKLWKPRRKDDDNYYYVDFLK